MRNTTGVENNILLSLNENKISRKNQKHLMKNNNVNINNFTTENSGLNFGQQKSKDIFENNDHSFSNIELENGIIDTKLPNNVIIQGSKIKIDIFKDNNSSNSNEGNIDFFNKKNNKKNFTVFNGYKNHTNTYKLNDLMKTQNPCVDVFNDYQKFQNNCRFTHLSQNILKIQKD